MLRRIEDRRVYIAKTTARIILRSTKLRLPRFYPDKRIRKIEEDPGKDEEGISSVG